LFKQKKLSNRKQKDLIEKGLRLTKSMYKAGIFYCGPLVLNQFSRIDYNRIRGFKKRVTEELYKRVGARKLFVLYERAHKTNKIWKEKIRTYKDGEYKDISKIDYIRGVAKKALKDKELMKSVDDGRATLTVFGEEVKNTNEFFSKKIEEIDNILPENLKRKTDQELDEIVKKWIASL